MVKNSHLDCEDYYYYWYDDYDKMVKCSPSRFRWWILLILLLLVLLLLFLIFAFWLVLWMFVVMACCVYTFEVHIALYFCIMDVCGGGLLVFLKCRLKVDHLVYDPMFSWFLHFSLFLHNKFLPCTLNYLNALSQALNEAFQESDLCYMDLFLFKSVAWIFVHSLVPFRVELSSFCTLSLWTLRHEFELFTRMVSVCGSFLVSVCGLNLSTYVRTCSEFCNVRLWQSISV